MIFFATAFRNRSQHLPHLFGPPGLPSDPCISAKKPSTRPASATTASAGPDRAQVEANVLLVGPNVVASTVGLATFSSQRVSISPTVKAVGVPASRAARILVSKSPLVRRHLAVARPAVGTLADDGAAHPHALALAEERRAFTAAPSTLFHGTPPILRARSATRRSRLAVKVAPGFFASAASAAFSRAAVASAGRPGHGERRLGRRPRVRRPERLAQELEDRVEAGLVNRRRLPRQEPRGHVRDGAARASDSTAR